MNYKKGGEEGSEGDILGGEVVYVYIVVEEGSLKIFSSPPTFNAFPSNLRLI